MTDLMKEFMEEIVSCISRDKYQSFDNISLVLIKYGLAQPLEPKKDSNRQWCTSNSENIVAEHGKILVEERAENVIRLERLCGETIDQAKEIRELKEKLGITE